MSTIEIDYETYMQRLTQIEFSYLSPRTQMSPDLKEKGLNMCMNYRYHLEQEGPENFRYFLNTANGAIGYVEKGKCKGCGADDM